MFRCLAIQALRLASRSPSALFKSNLLGHRPTKLPEARNQARSIISLSQKASLFDRDTKCHESALFKIGHPSLEPNQNMQVVRGFHAKGSKAQYLDFRYRLNTSHLRSHLLIIRRQKMKKHQRRKWRKKFKCMLAKRRLKREIAKEKTFRTELLTMIRRAEQFDPREYAVNKIREMNNRPRPLTKQEWFEDIKEKVRVNRYQTTYIKPKHQRPETYGLDPIAKLREIERSNEQGKR